MTDVMTIVEECRLIRIYQTCIQFASNIGWRSKVDVGSLSMWSTIMQKMSFFQKIVGLDRSVPERENGIQRKKNRNGKNEKDKGKNTSVHNFPISGADPEYVLRPSINTQI